MNVMILYKNPKLGIPKSGDAVGTRQRRVRPHLENNKNENIDTLFC